MSDVKGLKMLQRLLDNGKDDNSFENVYIVFNKIDAIAEDQREIVKNRWKKQFSEILAGHHINIPQEKVIVFEKNK